MKKDNQESNYEREMRQYSRSTEDHQEIAEIIRAIARNGRIGGRKA